MKTRRTVVNTIAFLPRPDRCIEGQAARAIWFTLYVPVPVTVKDPPVERLSVLTRFVIESIRAAR